MTGLQVSVYTGHIGSDFTNRILGGWSTDASADRHGMSMSGLQIHSTVQEGSGKPESGVWLDFLAQIDC